VLNPGVQEGICIDRWGSGVAFSNQGKKCGSPLQGGWGKVIQGGGTGSKPYEYGLMGKQKFPLYCQVDHTASDRLS
jgi:hypothetical protein